MKKILFVIPSLGAGGAERQLLRLIKGINIPEVEIHLCALRDGGTFDKEVPKFAKRIHLVSYKNILKSVLTIRKYINRNDISIIHSFLPLANIYISFSILFMKKKPEFIISVRSLVRNFFRRNFFLNQFSFFFADIIVANSGTVRINIEKKYSVDQEKIRLIYNGIDCSEFPKKNKLKKNKSGFTILFIGRFDKNKGISILAEIIGKICGKGDIDFILVGKGPLKEDVIKIISDSGVSDKVEYVSEATDVVQYFSRSDLFVLPTLLEGLSNVVMEAMAAGVPVITTDIPANKELIIDGLNGFLVPPNDSSALYEKIIFVLKNQELINTITRNARAKIEQDFSAEKMVNKYSALYDS